MLYRSNILALVGGGKNPKYSPNKVILWDDYNAKVISELRFTSNVKNVKLKKEKIIVVCESKIYIFSFTNFQNIDTLDTFDNPKGIIAVSSDKNSTVIAYPDKTKGYVRVKPYEKSFNTLIAAHESHISFLALNSDGTLLATASDKGTLIRIYSTETGNFLTELRRGTEKAEIYSICFNATSKFIACSSDRGTIHIFSLNTATEKLSKEQKEGGVLSEEQKIEPGPEDEQKKDEAPKNQRSFLSVFKKILPLPKYFNSEWSFSQFRIPDLKSICSFGPNNKIIAVSADGVYYQGSFDEKKGGECAKVSEQKLSDLSNK